MKSLILSSKFPNRKMDLMQSVLTLSICIAFLFILSCDQARVSESSSAGPYFGNGVHNAWADQHSISLWSRLTRNPELNREGAQFLDVSNELHRALRTSTNLDSLHGLQVPEPLTLEDMEGACPGAPGEVKLVYYPKSKKDALAEIDWSPVDETKNFTIRWHLDDLRAGTEYEVVLYARSGLNEAISDSLMGTFQTAPDASLPEDVSFCIVTCHDYIRRDDSLGGHLIYPAMKKLAPDFLVHAGDIEYYDKPLPYALTEPLMYFKWDRLFALPFQRDFYSSHTTYFMKDDHDVLSDDAYPGMTYGTVSFDRGLEIFDQEMFPQNNVPYKTVQWGKDLQIWLVEGRNFRSKNTDDDGPDKTIWGNEQREWLFATMSASDATFKVLFSPTPILGPDRDKKRDNYSNSNFKYEGDIIREFLNAQENLFICVGDRHWQYVTHPEGTNLWEFSAGAGADAHAGGWKQEDRRSEHRFLRVQGGFLYGHLLHRNGYANLILTHFDVHGNQVHQEVFNQTIN